MNNSPRLNQQLIDLQQEVDAASLKLKEMRQVLILETRVEEKLRLEHHIESTAKILDQLHQRYDELEEKLEEIGLKELPDAAKNPYKSLAAFQEQDAEQFFGREVFVQELLQEYQQVNLLPLLGPSGSGKSSVARAGLIPKLKKIDNNLQTIILTPTDRPLENLANHLARLILPNDPFPIAKTKEFEDFLLKEKDALRRILSSFIATTHQTVLILIDQFEEIYTLCKDKILQTAFIENILTLNDEQHLSAKIVLTLRSDFLGETQQHSKLNQIIAKQSIIVPAMNEHELRDAISKPAQLMGHPLDEATINLLLEQSEGRASALPLLQFALTQIWDNLSKGISAAQTLNECGGVGGALAKKAQEIFEQLTEEDQKVTRRIFLKLVQLGEGAKDTRRRTPLNEMVAQHDDSADKVKVILERFARQDARLLSLATQNIENTGIFAEITHEALLDNWQQLQEWLKDGREAERFHRRVYEAAQLWQLNQRPIGSLWRSPDLDLLATFYASHAEDMTALEIDFFNSSREQQQREINEKLKQQRRLKLLTTVSLLIAIIAGFFYFKAKEQKEIANEQNYKVSKLMIDLMYRTTVKLEKLPTTRELAIDILENSIKLFGTNDELRLKAKILQRLGEVWLKHDNTTKAISSYQQSIELANLGQHNIISFEASLSLGDIQLQLDNTTEALKAYEQCLKISTRDIEWRSPSYNSFFLKYIYLSSRYGELGQTYLKLKNVEQALQSFQQMKKMAEEIVAAAPRSTVYQNNLVWAILLLGDAYLKLGNIEQALQAYQQGLEISRKLTTSDPLNSVSYNRLGDAQLRLGNTEQALQAYQQGFEVAKKLTAADPLNSELQRNLSISYYKIAGFHLKKRDLKEALEGYQQALSIVEKLIEKDPQNQILKNDLKAYQDVVSEIKQQLEETATQTNTDKIEMNSD